MRGEQVKERRAGQREESRSVRGEQVNERRVGN